MVDRRAEEETGAGAETRLLKNLSRKCKMHSRILGRLTGTNWFLRHQKVNFVKFCFVTYKMDKRI